MRISDWSSDVCSSDLAEYMLSDSWSVTLSNAFGHSRSYTNSDGLICTRCVYEALNGTTAASGALSRATNIPLTTENALDVWQPNGGRASDEIGRAHV